MTKKLLTVKVESLKLQFTGLLPGEHPQPKPDSPEKETPWPPRYFTRVPARHP